jgi:hypothetical protein
MNYDWLEITFIDIIQALPFGKPSILVSMLAR